AKAIVTEAEARAAALLGDAEGRLTQIRSERESVAGYIENLRGVLAQAETIAADHGFPTSPPDDTVEVATQQAAEPAEQPDEQPDEQTADEADEDEEAREREHAN
ncbi:MAG: hypothetical protein ABIQ01_07400, partial [Pseudolysinimonas sp.]